MSWEKLLAPNGEGWPSYTQAELAAAGLTPELFSRYLRPAQLGETFDKRMRGLRLNNLPYVPRGELPKAPPAPVRSRVKREPIWRP